MKVNLKIFNIIYKYNLWLFGSGSGSLAINNKPYINFLQNFIKEKSIKSIIDIGCGDWQLFERINLSNTKYLGLDLVESVIESNKKKYGNKNVQFQCKDILEYDDLPEADLIIIKDVLQHLSNENINKVLDKLDNLNSKYILIINDVSKINLNVDVPDGLYRPINVNRAPFNQNYKIVFSYYEKLYLLYYILSLIIIIYFVYTKKYKLYIFSLLALILYGIFIIPSKKVFLRQKNL